MGRVRSGLGAALGLLAATAASCGIVESTVQATTASGEPDGPVVRAEFSGNAALIDQTLFAACRGDLLRLSEGASADGAAYDAALSVADRYRAAGYPDVAVDAEVVGSRGAADPPAEMTVRIAVEEGPLVTVRSLEWSGLGGDLGDPDELLRLWVRRGSGPLGLGDPIFVREELDALATAVRSTLRQRGHLRATVELRGEERHDDDSVSLTIHASPGPRYAFGEVTIAAAILAALDGPPDRPTGPFSRQRVQEFVVTLRAALRRQGYPTPEVRAMPVSIGKALEVPVRIDGAPGEAAEFGAVRIAGNELTDEDYIRSKLRFEPGEPFDGSAIEESVRSLYRSRVFSRVRIEPQPIADGRAPIQIQVEETDRHKLEFLAGYGSYERLRGGVDYTGRNLFGVGREIRLAGRISQRGYQALTSFTDRDLFESDLSGTVRASLFRREEVSFTDQAADVTAFLGFENWGFGTRVGYGLTERLDSRVFADSPASELENFTEGRIFVELFRDTRDSVVAPTRGYNASVEVDAADSALGSDVDYQRIRAHLAGHLPLGGRTRLSMRWTTGALWPGDGSDRVPLQVRFYNGGENTVRSFRQDRLGPVDNAGLPVGGEFRNVFSIELRHPLQRTIEASLFADAGNVGSAVGDFGLRDVSYALGVGLRIVLPIGPLRVDAAYNPDRLFGQDEWVTQFSVGYPF